MACPVNSQILIFSFDGIVWPGYQPFKPILIEQNYDTMMAPSTQIVDSYQPHYRFVTTVGNQLQNGI